MIDFACKRFDLKEVIRCSLGLTKTEFKLLEHLIKCDKRITALELSKRFYLGLSTTQKAIKKLYREELIKRSQTNLKNGGYIFTYSIREKKILKKKILEIISLWTKKVEKELKKW